jgi:AAA15 family ATPase/GTPase
MDWTEIKRENNDIQYNCTKLYIGLEEFKISWKNYKNNPDYDVFFSGKYITTSQSLEEAKKEVLVYMKKLHKTLGEYLDSNN